MSRPLAVAFALALPSLAAAVPITSYTLLLPGQVVSDLLHDVADAGDVNLDGRSDQLLGDPLNGPAGTVALRYGGPPPFGGFIAPVNFLGANPGDRFGTAVDGVGDVNCDGVGDVVIGAPGFDSGSGVDSGAVFVWFGPIGPGAYPVGSADMRIMGEAAGDHAGHSVQLVRDMDGDGCSEVAIGAPFHAPSSGLPGAGAAYVAFSATTPPSVVLNAGTALKVTGSLPSQLLGFAVDRAGDFDANGTEDLLVGAPGFTLGPAPTGAALVVYDPYPLWIAGVSGGPAAPVSLTLHGENGGDQAGFSVDGGQDGDADGAVDLIVGAPRHTMPAGAFSAGAAYLASGAAIPPGPGLVLPLVPVSEKRFGVWQGGQLGFDVSFLYDVNLDGWVDWAASAPFEGFGGGQGRVHAHLAPGPILVGVTLPIGPTPSVDAVPNMLGVGYAIDGGRNSDTDPQPDPIIGFFYTVLSRNGLATF